MEKSSGKSIFWAILAAALYAISSPVSKLFLAEVDATMMAAFLYLGAGVGMTFMGLFRKKSGKKKEEHLTMEDFPYTVGMVVLDIAAPVFLMAGLKTCAAANVSLLNNFEIVATSLIALALFQERISPRLFFAIFMITLSSILLSVEDAGSLQFSGGSLFVILACICWGFENNCTRKLSAKDPLEIVVIKGFGSGCGSLILGVLVGEKVPPFLLAVGIMTLGFVAYGLSIFFYVSAQRTLGAARTSAYYAVSPFIGAFLSLIFLKERPEEWFPLALLLMLFGTAFVTMDELDIPEFKLFRGLPGKCRGRQGKGR